MCSAALFRGLYSQVSGEKGGGQNWWKMKGSREKCQRVFFPHVECGCGGLEKTRRRMEVKVWWGVGGAERSEGLWWLQLWKAINRSTLLFPLYSPHQCHPQTYMVPHLPATLPHLLFLHILDQTLEAKLELLAEPVICEDLKKILSTVISMLNAKRRSVEQNSHEG